MDQSRFDDITRVLAAPSRRSLLSIAGAVGIATLLGWDEREAGAGRKKKKKKKKKKPSATSPSCTPSCTGGRQCDNGTCVCTGTLRDCGANGCRECCNSTDCCPPGRANCLEADGNRARTCTEAGVCACAGEFPFYGDVFGNGAAMCWLCLEDGHCILDEFANSQGRHNCFFGNCVCPDATPDLCRVFGSSPLRNECTNITSDPTNCGGCGNPPCNAQIGQSCVNGVCTNPGAP